MKLVLELDDDQECFLGCTLARAAKYAWEITMQQDMDDDEVDGKSVAFWRGELAAAEAIMAQLPSSTMQFYRDSLHVNDDDDEEES